MTRPANIQGVVSATLSGNDGDALTFIAPAERCGDEIRISREHVDVLHCAMRAAGVATVELEFSEVNGDA